MDMKKDTKAGIESGIEKKQIQIVNNMKDENFDISTISKITGLTETEIDIILSNN